MLYKLPCWFCIAFLKWLLAVGQVENVLGRFPSLSSLGGFDCDFHNLPSDVANTPFITNQWIDPHYIDRSNDPIQYEKNQAFFRVV
jgi:hypothetical protein